MQVPSDEAATADDVIEIDQDAPEDADPFVVGEQYFLKRGDNLVKAFKITTLERRTIHTRTHTHTHKTQNTHPHLPCTHALFSRCCLILITF